MLPEKTWFPLEQPAPCTAFGMFRLCLRSVPTAAVITALNLQDPIVQYSMEFALQL